MWGDKVFIQTAINTGKNGSPTTAPFANGRLPGADRGPLGGAGGSGGGVVRAVRDRAAARAGRGGPAGPRGGGPADHAAAVAPAHSAGPHRR